MENSFKNLNSKSESELKKTEYFSKLARSVKNAFALHNNEGNLWQKKDGKEDWKNVSEHCLVEIARVNTLGALLELNQETVKDLMYAAALHDFSKKKEKELQVPEGGITWEQYDKEISQWSRKTIAGNGLSENIVELSGSVGHDSLIKTEDLLKKDKNELSESDIAYLVMHYVDNYTLGSDWVKPINGMTNEIDNRTEKDKNNPTLKNLQEDSKKILNGRNYVDVMKDTGHDIEKLIVKLIKEKKNIEVDPLRLPEFIDEEIKKEINI